MSKEVIEVLSLKSGDTVVDCTVGTGGHAEEILRMISPKGKLIGVDRDIDSLAMAKDRLNNFHSNLELVHEDFRNLDEKAHFHELESVDALEADV